ncbi:hypothetical protein [Geodermatophilus sp. CPCC 206100]|uniref:hypothetical protein n=1 Tax=Geodermatophilus sp. CPCC 206100 TaxID=3020054 RepID=UPI003AFF62D3
MIVGAILVCEVLFWLFLAAGLAARYLLRRPRLGLVLLLGSPAADLALLALTAVDLRRGGVPTQAHALAAVYLGFTVGFGHSVVHWADQHVAHRLAGGPPVTRPRRLGRRRAEHEWREFGKAAVAWAVCTGLLLGMTLLAHDLDRARVLLGYAGMSTVVLAIWFLTGPVPASVRARSGHAADGSDDEARDEVGTRP